MPPRKVLKQKGGTSASARAIPLGPSSPFDKSRFVDADGAQIYAECLGKRVLPERGIDVECFRLAESWKKLAETPPAAVVPVVREFYANASNREDSVSIVRGQRVDFSRARINSYFGLHNIDNTNYKANLNLPISVALVNATLCIGEAQW